MVLKAFKIMDLDKLLKKTLLFIFIKLKNIYFCCPLKNYKKLRLHLEWSKSSDGSRKYLSIQESNSDDDKESKTGTVKDLMFLENI